MSNVITANSRECAAKVEQENAHKMCKVNKLNFISRRQTLIFTPRRLT